MDNDLVTDLKKRIANKEVIVVAGAGVSKAIAGDAAPDWRTLIGKGIERCTQLGRTGGRDWADRAYNSLQGDITDMLSVAEQISSRLGWNEKNERCDGEWGKWLFDTLGTLRARDTRLIQSIRSLGIQIATLNYDGLLHQEMRLNPLPWTRAAQWVSVIKGDRDGILHLHGYWDAPESVVLGTRSYTHLLEDPLSQFLQQVMTVSKSLLFIGCGQSFEDPNFRQLIRWMTKVLHGVDTRHYLLTRRDEQPSEQNRFSPDAHIHVLPYGVDHDELPGYLDSLAPPAPAGTRRSRRKATDWVLGRETETEEIVSRILADDQRPIAILGGAGIGKSTLMASVMDARDIRLRFSDRCWFVSCKARTSAAALRAACAPAEDVVQSNEGQYGLLLLDNLDTTWHADSKGLENTLTELAAVPGLVILASLRGRETPSCGFTWARIEVTPLGREWSRELFHRITDNAFSNDRTLDLLLDQATADIPLAVVLLARAAQGYPNLAPVWRRWQHERTRMLTRDANGTKDASLASSLELSITSRRVTEDAQRLLALMGMLPSGLRDEDTEVLLLGGWAAADCLVKVGLANCEHDRFHLYQPVREYVKAMRPPRADDLDRAIKRYAAIANERGSRVTASQDDPDYKWLFMEAANIEVMLAEGLERDPGPVLAGVAGYGRFLRLSAGKRSEVLRRAAILSAQRGDQRTAAACWYCDAELARVGGDPDLAQVSYQTALAAYRVVEDPLGQAETLVGLGELEQNSENAQRHCQGALRLFQSLGNQPGTARVMFRLAQLAPENDKPKRFRSAWRAALRSGDNALLLRIEQIRNQFNPVA